MMKKTVISAAIYIILLFLSSCTYDIAPPEPPLELTEEEFYFYTPEGEKYIPPANDYNFSFVSLSSLQDTENKNYTNKRGLALGDSAMKIFELYDINDFKWEYDINFNYNEADNNDVSGEHSAVSGLYSKIKFIKSKEEYISAKNAEGIVKNEKAYNELMEKVKKSKK
jgi:hypothetical protein